MSLAKPSHGRNLRSGLLLTFWLLAGFGLQTGAQAESRVEPVTESDALEYRVEAMAENLGVVWGMTWVAPDRLLFTQRQGEAGVLAIDSGEVTPLHGLPLVYDLGQGGLLDVQRAPDYEASGWLYFTYSKPQGNGAVTTLARARLQGDRLVAWQDLLVTRSASSRTIHFGSRIAFDDQGHVFFSVGDRGERDRAQDLSNHAGTILRLNLDGSVPADNPFVGVEGALDEIWSYGHRNPQGLAYDAKQRRLWAIEHGPRGGDELNWVQKAKITVGRSLRRARSMPVTGR
jgi:glucose/arabinose dehydrogenase